jgi:hypothetical protein
MVYKNDLTTLLILARLPKIFYPLLAWVTAKKYFHHRSFRRCFSRYQALNNKITSLSTQITNLKLDSAGEVKITIGIKNSIYDGNIEQAKNQYLIFNI